MTAALIVVPACTINNKLSELKDHEILVESKTGSIQDLHSLAKDNVPVAIGRLSQEYYDGVNLKRDDEKAFYWANKGDELGDPLATLLLARMNYLGEVTEKNPKKAIALLEKIKDQRLDARYILGKMYEEQAVNHPEYFDMGLAEIKQAAELGFSEAQVDMAETLRVGGTTSKTLSDAVKSETLKQSADYLAMAVAQGNVIAMRNLGWYYRDGIGIPQDAVKAKELLSQAANQGDSIAKEYLDQLGE